MGIQGLSQRSDFRKQGEGRKSPLQRHGARFLLALAASVFFTGCGEMVEEEVEIGLQGIAKYDHFLAASRMLREMGLETGSYAQLPQFPPPPNTTLFLPASALKSEGMLSELDDWVYSDGGVLICFLERGGDTDLFQYDQGASKDFLDYFEIGYEQISDFKFEVVPEDKEEKKEYFKKKMREELDSIKPNKKEDAEKAEDEEEDPTEVKELVFEEEGEMRPYYKTDFTNNYYIHYTDVEYAEDEDDDFICLDYDWGEGRIHMWSTVAPFTNDHLMKEEHATLLWDLVQLGEPKRVWFVHSSQLSFMKLLWEKGAFALVTLALLLFLWIWASTQRFGPMFKTINATKNTLSDHLTASGYFFTKHKADALIIEAVKEKLYMKLARQANLPINAPAETIISVCETKALLNNTQLDLLKNPLPEKKAAQLLYISELQTLSSTL